MAPKSRSKSGFGQAWLALALVGLAAILMLQAPGRTELIYGLPNDSAMRLVTIRDLLAGQGWFEMTQTRLGLEGGFEMHWSRLVDAPIAGLILAFDLVLDRAGAEYAAVLIWPLLMLCAAVVLSWRIGLALAGPSAGIGAALIASLSLSKSGRFLPGALDHHNVQIVLLLAVLLGVLARRPLASALAGVALAASLAIGVETLPLLAVCAVGFAVFWIRGADSDRGATLCFATGIVGGLAVLFPATAPASAWQGGYCDALSRDLALPVVLSAAALALAALGASHRGWRTRAVVLGALAVPVAIVTLLAFPACLSNPLDALAPELKTLWLDFVVEAHSLTDVLHGAVELQYLGAFVAGLFGFGAATGLAWTERSARWAMMAAVLATALALTAYQLRGGAALAALAAIPLGAVAAQLFLVWRGRGARWAGLGAIMCVLAALPSIWSGALLLPSLLTPQPATAADTARTGASQKAARLGCFDTSALQRLAELPTGVVSAGANLGAQLLLHTPHRVLSAPYHRNQAGMTAQFQIALAADAVTARRALRAHGVDYVAVCAADPEYAALADRGFEGFARRLESGEVPDFLVPIAPAADGGLRIYKVR